jgi:hypothetical protein
LLPPAFAVLLTLAAGLSLAEEHAWHQAEAPYPAPRPDALQQPAKAAHTPGAEQRSEDAMRTRHHPVTAVGHSPTPGTGGTGVGSRALIGD